MCTWAMNRSKITWGDDAETFRPERWLEEDDTAELPNAENQIGQRQHKRWRLLTKSSSEFPVFHGGPRSCLGRKMAELLGVYVIATLVWEYDFEEDVAGDGARKERVSKNSLTLPMEGGLPCFVKTRKRL